MDKLDARKHFDFNLLRISPEFLMGQNIFISPIVNWCTIFYNMFY